MSDTPLKTPAPRTKAKLQRYIWNSVEHNFVSAEFAEQLERELDETRAALSGRTVSCAACNESARTIAEMREAIKEAFPLIETLESSARSSGSLPMCPDCKRIGSWDEDHSDECKIGKALTKLQPFLK